MNQSFSGSYTHNLDKKGRVSLPVRFRESLVGRVHITRGADDERYLWVFSDDGWTLMVNKLNGLPNNKMGNEVRRHFIGNEHESKIDRLGRIQISPLLREYARLDREVVIMGVGDRIEIWEKSIKEKHDAASEQDGVIQKYMEELGI